MGMEDRDWYRDHWRKKQGYVEKAKFRVPMKQLEDLERAFQRAQQEEQRRKKPHFNWWNTLLAVILVLWFVVKIKHIFHL